MKLFSKYLKFLRVAFIGIGFLYFGISALIKEYNLRKTIEAESLVIEGEIAASKTDFYSTGGGMYRQYVWIAFKDRKDTLYSNQLSQSYQAENGFLSDVTSELKPGQKLKVRLLKNGAPYNNIVEVSSGEKVFLTIDDMKIFKDRRLLIYVGLGFGIFFTVLIPWLLKDLARRKALSEANS